MQFNEESFVIESIDPIHVRIQGMVPWREVEKKFDETYREIAKNMRFRGFRKGKVPRQMLEKMFQKHVKDDLLQELTREALVEFLRVREDIRPADSPREWKITPGEFQKGESLPFVSELELIPEVAPEHYDALEATKLVAKVKDESVEKELERLLSRHTRMESFQGSLSDGVHLQLSAMGKVGDEPVSLENAMLVLGKEPTGENAELLVRMANALAGFELPEVPYEAELELPADGDQPEGRVLVEIHRANRVLAPELNDDFARETGRADNLEGLRVALREDLEKDLKLRSDHLLERELLDRINEKNAFEVGSGLIRRQAEMKVDQVLMQLGVDPENEAFAETRRSLAGNYLKKAEKEIRDNLLLEGIAKKENVTVSDEEMEKKLQEIADQANKSLERIRADYQRDGKIEQIRYMLRMERTLELIKSRAVITESEVDELPNPQEEEGSMEEHECGPECDHDHS